MNWKIAFGLLGLAGVLALLGQNGATGGGCNICLALPTSMPAVTPSLSLPYSSPPERDVWKKLSGPQRLGDVRSRLLPKLTEELAAKAAKLGDAAFVRVFKETKELELWLHTGKGWTLFRTYPIAVFSGTLGPKTREGDLQAPEGFYRVTARSLNPSSKYHLSFNIGYPNDYDHHHQRTGSLIMIHGDEVSIGCFAMTDSVIEEIYMIVAAALTAGQKEMPVHVFPFRMNEQRLAEATDSPHIDFWRELRPGYEWFETKHQPPAVRLENGRHVLEEML